MHDSVRSTLLFYCLVPLTTGYDLYSSTMYHTSFKLWIILLKFCIILFLATTENKSIIIIIIIINFIVTAYAVAFSPKRASFDLTRFQAFSAKILSASFLAWTFSRFQEYAISCSLQAASSGLIPRSPLAKRFVNLVPGPQYWTRYVKLKWKFIDNFIN